MTEFTQELLARNNVNRSGPALFVHDYHLFHKSFPP